MSEDKKKRGLLGKLFGRKSKEDKLAEAAAEKAAQQNLVDEQMAARMAAINAAALKSAREMDEASEDTPAEDLAKIEAAEKAEAEAKALKSVERAKALAAEKAEMEAKALEKAKAEAAAKAKAEKQAAEKTVKEAEAAKQKAAEEARLAKEAAAAKLAQEKADAKRAKDEAAALAKVKDAEEAKALAAQQAKDAQAREEARERDEEEAKAAKAEETRLEAERAEAERIEAERLEAERLEAERIEAEKAEQAEKLVQAEAAPEVEVQPESVSEPEPEAEITEAPKGGFFSRITRGLRKSTSRMSESMATVFKKRKLDDEAIEELQDLLIASDLGVGPSIKVTDRLARDKFDKDITDMEIKIALADVISEILTPLEKPLTLTGAKPEIMVFVGVNGSGKTTTLGKLAKRYTDQGKKVLLCAGDTFRAAAVQQLTIWGERSGADLIAGKEGADAAGLVFDAIQKAKTENYDILMIDTAGRLQNRTELMDELAKVIRVIKKQDETAPHHSILVLDATVGQNALIQTEAFRDTAGTTGLVMTKLDGTAKGGVLVALSDKFGLPIHAIGIGERIEDLENFSAPVFAAALSGVADTVMGD